ncbi:Zorya protein ZorC EH domain-containing protein [Gammaproteobacteria bacterium]
MSLRNAVGEIPSGWKPGLHSSLPSVSKTELKRTEIEARLQDLSAKNPGVDLMAVREKLILANRNGDWNIIDIRDWRFASECLSMGQTQEQLIRDETFVKTYLVALGKNTSLPALRRLVRYYLMQFDPSLPAYQHIGVFLSQRKADCGLWGERHTRFEIFDVRTGLHRLADEAMSFGTSPRKFLESIGFTGSLATARLTGEAFISACRKVQKSLETSTQASADDLLRLADWAVVNGTFVYGGIPQAKSAFAEGMLLPWSTRNPGDEIREFVLSFMLRLFKDPRLNATTWIGVSEDAKKVMLRWLTKASLEQFLGVVDEVVASEHKHMWDARRKFWGSYYDKEYMQEAWVVFGKRGVDYIRRLAQKDHQGTSDLGFGSFVHGSVQDQTQAVLIMRIGSLVVADWSHNGSCHIWNEYNPHAPKFYRSAYKKSELNTGSVFNKRHQGRWQTDVYNFIHQETGLRMFYNEYMI